MPESNRCMYNAALKDFLRQPSAVVRDEIVEACHGTVLDTALDAWKGEIALLQSCLKCWENEDAHILFKYDIPHLGKRIDVVLLLRGIVFCLEFKVGRCIASRRGAGFGLRAGLEEFRLFAHFGGTMRSLRGKSTNAMCFRLRKMLPM